MSKQEILRILRPILAEGYAKGLSIDDIARSIRKTIVTEYAESAAWRAVRIARTEVIGASNQGQVLGFQSQGLEGVKIWVATLDGKTRDTHALMGGQEVDSNEAFDVGGDIMQFPGDMNGSAENVINCRCTVAFRVKVNY